MSHFHPRQRRKHPAVPSPTQASQLPTAPSFALSPSHPPLHLSGDLQADLEQARHAGWSFERIALTRDDLEPEHRYAVKPAQEREAASPSAPVLQPKAIEPVDLKENTTGLPNHLKAGVEALSGFSLDDVHVHYNSSKPAEVQALAYTQGTEIHVGPGQEQHLSHEAWHVVQQKQGRVKPLVPVKGVMLNNEPGLETEAETMGAHANSRNDHLLLPPLTQAVLNPLHSLSCPIQLMPAGPHPVEKGDFLINAKPSPNEEIKGYGLKTSITFTLKNIEETIPQDTGTVGAMTTKKKSTARSKPYEKKKPKIPYLKMVQFVKTTQPDGTIFLIKGREKAAVTKREAEKENVQGGEGWATDIRHEKQEEGKYVSPDYGASYEDDDEKVAVYQMDNQIVLNDFPSSNGSLNFAFETIVTGAGQTPYYGSLKWGFSLEKKSDNSFAITNEYAHADSTLSPVAKLALDKHGSLYPQQSSDRDNEE